MSKETENTTSKVVASPDPSKELVPIKLFKDNGKYKDNVFVAVNGRSWNIKRGERVMVPRYVAELLEQSMDQDAATAQLIEKEAAKAKDKALE